MRPHWSVLLRTMYACGQICGREQGGCGTAGSWVSARGPPRPKHECGDVRPGLLCYRPAALPPPAAPRVFLANRNCCIGPTNLKGNKKGNSAMSCLSECEKKESGDEPLIRPWEDLQKEEKAETFSCLLHGNSPIHLSAHPLACLA